MTVRVRLGILEARAWARVRVRVKSKSKNKAQKKFAPPTAKKCVFGFGLSDPAIYIIPHPNLSHEIFRRGHIPHPWPSS